MMKKTVIVYASKHHGNTFKLVKAICDKYEIAMIDATKEAHVDLQEFDTIGFASGIDFGKFYLEIENFARENLPFQKEVFFLYTCAMDRNGFTDSIKEIALGGFFYRKLLKSILNPLMLILGRPNLMKI